MGSGASGRRHGRLVFAIFALLLFSYSYYPPMHDNPNPVSHMALAVSLVERGDTAIDGFRHHTIDKSSWNGHYYSNKPPGLAFTAVPAVFIVSFLFNAMDIDGEYLKDGEFTMKWMVAIYAATIATSGLFSAATAAGIYVVGRSMGASIAGGLIAALGFGLASPAWGWATNFFNHALAGSLLFLGFAVVHHLTVRGSDARRFDVLGGSIAGLLLGWSIVVEYAAGPAAVVIGGYGLFMARRWSPDRVARVVLATLGGGIVAALPLLVYNGVSFGSPFALSYQHDVSFEGFERGALGFSLPNPEALYGITLSPFRGLLVFCPLAVLYPLAIHRLARSAGGGAVAVVSLIVVGYFLLLNSSFYYWHGGSSTGPRYLVPMLPFVFLPYAQYWTSRVVVGERMLIVTLLVVSFGLSLLSVSTSMAAWQEIENPLRDFLIPRFLESQIRTVFLVVGWRSKYAVLIHVVILTMGLWLIHRSARRARST